LGAIHALWKPVPGRFKDYVAMPKFNMYQSLHTTVIGPKGRPLEIQIRTYQMHRTAEYGIAAHWKYKEGVKDTGKVDERLGWFRQMLEWQTELKDPREFMEALKIDLFKDEVFVFTPKGDVISLPAGSTPLDFAYSIHTDVGNHCVGAKVNNKIVALAYHLQMGDIVEVMTSKSSPGPSRDWLAMVQTSRARSKIRQALSREIKEDSAQLGKEALIKLLRKHCLTLRVAIDSQMMEKIAKNMNFQKTDDLYASIGTGKTSPKHVVTRIINAIARETPEAELKEEKIELPVRPVSRPAPSGVRVKGIEDVLIRLAHCCNPVPGDEITGFVTRGRGVSVHRKDCPNIRQLMNFPDRMLEVTWDVKPTSTYQVEIQVEALDRTKLLRDISAVISDAGVNIISASVNTTKEGLAIFRFIFEIGNLAHLKNIIEEVKQIDAVFDAYRI
jgi:GTP pyrophosphokinase